MSAEMHIHILTPNITAVLLAVWNSHHLNSRHFALYNRRDAEYPRLFETMANTPNVRVGDVSWLKAALFDADETFIPDAIGALAELFDEDGTLIDDALIQAARKALALPNSTGYEVADSSPVLAFLEANKGQRAITISW